MRWKSALLFALVALASLPAAAFSLGLLEPGPGLSAPDALGLLLIGLLALGLSERDALDDPF